MTIRSGIIYRVIGQQTEINYRGYIVIADGQANGLDWCERYLNDNVLFSNEYIKHYIDKLYGGDNEFLGKIGENVWEFENVIFVHREWTPETDEEGQIIYQFKTFTLNNNLIAVQQVA